MNTNRCRAKSHPYATMPRDSRPSRASLRAEKPAPVLGACPNCGAGPERHDNNGASRWSLDYTRLCLDCGHQWSPNEG